MLNTIEEKKALKNRKTLPTFTRPVLTMVGLSGTRLRLDLAPMGKAQMFRQQKPYYMYCIRIQP